jgi:hypothetical protein
VTSGGHDLGDAADTAPGLGDGRGFHRTLADGWAYACRYQSEAERRAALPGWLHFNNHYSIHSAIGGPPSSRLNNLPGHHT